LSLWLCDQYGAMGPCSPIRNEGVVRKCIVLNVVGETKSSITLRDISSLREQRKLLLSFHRTILKGLACMWIKPPDFMLFFLLNSAQWIRGVDIKGEFWVLSQPNVKVLCFLTTNSHEDVVI
jgi:hypothetical protein